MPTTTLRLPWDSWMAEVGGTSSLGTGTSMSNGTGPRLQSGRRDVSGTIWKNRFVATSYDIDSTDPDENSGTPLPDSGATITSATWKAKVRGSSGCYDNRATPIIWIERTTDTDFQVAENALATECGVQSAGGTKTNPSTSTSDRAIYAPGSEPSAGTVISKDITTLFTNWYNASRSGKRISLLFHPDSYASESRDIAFFSWDEGSPDGGNAMEIVVVWSTNEPPAAPTLTSPTSGQRVTGTTGRTFTGTYSDPDGLATYQTEVVVATSSHVDGNGKLDTGVVIDETDTGFVASPWSVPLTFSQTRGSTYWWTARNRDVDGEWGPWATARSYVVNRLVVAAQVHP
jgi:hypothetical protein